MTDIQIPFNNDEEKEEKEGEAIFGVATHDSSLPSFDQAGTLLSDPGKTVQNEHVFDMLFNAYQSALSTVIEVLPESRAKSLAKTALEESHMWAKKAVNS